MTASPISVNLCDFSLLKSPRCALLGGFSVHANVSISAGKKDALERLCRYIVRPPVALSRLAQLSDGAICYRVKNLAPHQPAVLRFEPLVFMRKLAQLIPPPRVHIVRYFGVWAPNAKLRSKVVPPSAVATAADNNAGVVDSARGEMLERILRRPVLNWSELLRRVFAIDILACPCGGRRKVIAFITNPNIARKILDHIGLPSAPPQAVPARAPPQIDSDEFSHPILPG